MAKHDLSIVSDVTLSSDCDVDTDDTTFDCGDGAVPTWIEQQTDGSQIRVFAFKSLTLPPTAKLTVEGSIPAVLLAFGDMKLDGSVVVKAGQFRAQTSFTKGGGIGGGPAGVDNGGGPPPGTGALAGISAGGGSYCGLGAPGTQEVDKVGAFTMSPAAATPAYGTVTLTPLLAGSSGGVGGLGAAGFSGGAVQFVAGGTFSLGTLASINAGGGGGSDSGEPHGRQEASGGGSGGAILIEATTVTIAGTLAANGGGGGGHDGDGKDATPDAISAAGGTNNGAPQGGVGSAGVNINGTSGVTASDESAGGGGGGAGRIRINTQSGSAAITGALSPSLTTTCATQGAFNAAHGPDAGTSDAG